MAKRLRRSIEDIEKRLSKLNRKIRIPRDDARYHAMAVAAIVLSGQPNIDEPLRHAWERTLQHHGIDISEPGSYYDQVFAPKQLSRKIMDGADESGQFAQIFKSAPVWLLQFTGTAVDARLLKFQLPELSRRFPWGSAGYEDARRWPLLPLGRISDGEPIPRLDPRRLWIALFCQLTVGEFPDAIDFPSEEDEPITDPLLKDVFFALDLDGVPEEELSRYQKRRLRKLSERISRL
jgi:hypothetical protein